MVKKTCKWANREAAFLTTEHFDIINGEAKSQSGIWLFDENPICIRFSSIDEQWKKRGGFFFCDETKCERCGFFEE